MHKHIPKVRPPTLVSNPSLPPAALTGLLGVFGLTGTTLKTVLDHGYSLPAALYAAVVLGLTGTMLMIYVLSWFTVPSGPGGSPPGARA